jgi:hypothetical protein
VQIPGPLEIIARDAAPNALNAFQILAKVQNVLGSRLSFEIAIDAFVKSLRELAQWLTTRHGSPEPGIRFCNP